ncbi:hypothetical protein LSCM1_04625 [Leishmania martiniquensis]|uniref:Piwi domain-containing protein n=1 Tax=Leishmania martiniquensis TaxID=1580590 RepID=A0A836HK08_9TRYP|nr:hypothetical protein LSCM1_04625 [Leishmania martiniquensis]
MWSLFRSNLAAVSSAPTAAAAARIRCRYSVRGIAQGAAVIHLCRRHYHRYAGDSGSQGAPHRQRSASSAFVTNGRGGCGTERACSASAPPHQRPSQDKSLRQYRGQQRRNASLAAAEKASNHVASTRATFWSQSVRHVSTATLRQQHMLDRVQEKKSRFLVRSSVREDGVISNLFPLHFRRADASHQDCHGGAPPAGTYVYIYEVYVTRLTTPLQGRGAARAAGSAQGRGLAQVERRVSPGRAWRAVERFLHHRFGGAAAESLPPLVQVVNEVYAAAPLPAAALVLPRAYFDMGWQTAELRLKSRCEFTKLPPSKLQMLMNKIIPEVARAAHRKRRQQTGTSATFLEVVREKTGKLLCTTQGVSAGGLRLYRGVQVQAIFVDSSAALDPNAADARGNQVATETQTCIQPSAETGGDRGSNLSADAGDCPVLTRHLGDTPVGLTDAAALVHFQVVAFLRPFSYRGTPAESYRVRDASGVYLASLWSPARPRSLTVGAVYAAAPVRIREFAERGNARLIELLRDTTLTLISASTATAPTSPRSSKGSCSSATQKSSPLSGNLSLKIDTKGTIASEVSLWDEVLQHFSEGPYDEAAQQRIRKSVQGIPVVISYSLRQSIVRDVLFNSGALLTAATDTRSLAAEDGKGRSGDASDSSPTDDTAANGPAREHLNTPILCVREPRLKPLLPLLDSRQPCAVLTDHTIVPLQVLHCCYDPRMRGWQDIGVSALSLVPQKRSELLASVRALLADGLQRWGMDLAAAPYQTKTLSLLPTPMKCTVPKNRPATNFSNSTAAAFPTTIVVIGVTGPRCTAEQSRRITLTAQHLAHYFRTKLVATVADESAAVQYVHEQLMEAPAAAATPHSQPAAYLKDPNASVILITNEVGTRAARWLKVECMCRGVHLIAIPASPNPKRLALVGPQLRRRIATQFEVNPLRGVDLRGELPVLGSRHVLIIGVDSCHTNTLSVGTIVGILSTPTDNSLISFFWRHDARGRETQNVAKHFRGILADAVALSGRVDEVVVFQDGNVFSELVGFKEELTTQVPNCGLTFMCLHKRCNVRFMHASPGRAGGSATQRRPFPDEGKRHSDEKGDRGVGSSSGGNVFHNVVKGIVIPALAPVPLDHQLAASSFYLQTHESAMSTARIVQYTVHHVSPSLDVTDVQQIAHTMANVLAPQATKLPMSTRCAHRLADQAERLLDAVPQLTADMIPRPLCNRLWFL